jgi:hypothetical protein
MASMRELSEQILGQTILNKETEDYMMTPRGPIRRQDPFTPAQFVNFAASMQPGAGIADMAGELPMTPGPEAGITEAFSAEAYPSFGENISQGEYLDAFLQGLGGVGDALYATGPLGVAAGSVLKAPRALSKASKVADSGIAETAKDPKSIITTPKELNNGNGLGRRGAGDGGGRYSSGGLAPLKGAPAIAGATGPDPRLVSVAEKYAESAEIPLSRQPEYYKVSRERSKRIAQAYEDMPHDPTNPKVKAAYEDLIRQTTDQYQSLIDDGYEFSFFDSNSDPYGGNPFNAVRDLRQNKRMAVYGTYDGYGTEGITGAEIADNPMLKDTGLRWKDQDGVEQMVTANDLFRAVHDTFGHGLEGAGFRATGEENAWQAHARLFTGDALKALTTETRGQNSWLNYGPFGDTNRTAKLEGTVFAEQKTGLMPDWTSQEGR